MQAFHRITQFGKSMLMNEMTEPKGRRREEGQQEPPGPRETTVSKTDTEEQVIFLKTSRFQDDQPD